MIRRPPRSTRTDTLFPYTTLFRSDGIDYRETEEHRIGAQRGGIDDAQNIAVRLFPHAQKLFAARQRRNAAHVDRAFVADAFFAEAHAASRGRTVRNSIFLS